jgi:signal transduction histidine kinase
MLADHEMVDTLNTCLPKRLLLTALASACLLSVAIVGKASAQEELTAKFILEMPPNQSSEGIPVTLQGVVTEAVEQGMVVHDDTAGIWVYFDDSQRFHPGDLLQLTGKIARGMFAPVINASSVHRIGTAPMPRPTPATYIQLSSGDKDGQYVTVQGSVHAVGVLKDVPLSKRLRIKLQMQDGPLTVTMPEDDLNAARALIDANVRITGTALCSKNDNGQIIAPALATDSLSKVTVTKAPPGDLFSIPVMPIKHLMQYRSGTSYNQRVHVSGIVTYFQPGERLILESGGAALYVNTMQTEPLIPGDHIEAVGFPAASGSGPILDDAVVRRDATGPAPTPTPVAVPDVCTGKLNYNLVSVRAHLLREIREPSRDELLLQDGPQMIVAVLEGANAHGTLPDLGAGSTLTVAGIDKLEVAGSWNYGTDSAEAVRCTLLMRQPSDARMVASPSWWSVRHTFYIAVVLGLLAIASLFQAFGSRVQQWHLRAAMAERERLAHEIHDTLAQSFAGIGFQLQAIQRSVPDSLPQLRQQVRHATDLVRHSHKEARRSFAPPRTGEEQPVDLIAELERSVRQMLDDGLIDITVTITGDPVEMPVRMTAELLRIGQEAIANTVQHAAASRLDLLLRFSATYVALTVEDDGVGFVKSGDLLGFGLRGMRKRAASIGAQLEIDSAPGNGTRIRVTAPLPTRLAVSEPAKLIGTYLRSIFRHAPPHL